MVPIKCQCTACCSIWFFMIYFFIAILKCWHIPWGRHGCTVVSATREITPLLILALQRRTISTAIRVLRQVYLDFLSIVCTPNNKGINLLILTIKSFYVLLLVSLHRELPLVIVSFGSNWVLLLFCCCYWLVGFFLVCFVVFFPPGLVSINSKSA